MTFHLRPLFRLPLISTSMIRIHVVFCLQLFLLPSGVQINNDDMAKSFPPLQNNINVIMFCGLVELFTVGFQANTLAVSSLSRDCGNWEICWYVAVWCDVINNWIFLFKNIHYSYVISLAYPTLVRLREHGEKRVWLRRRGSTVTYILCGRYRGALVANQRHYQEATL